MAWCTAFDRKKFWCTERGGASAQKNGRPKGQKLALHRMGAPFQCRTDGLALESFGDRGKYATGGAEDR